MEKVTFINNQKLIGVIIILITIGQLLVVAFYTQTIVTYGEELHKNCPLPTGVCPYKRGALPIESVLGLIVAVALGVLGGYLIFYSKYGERVETRKKSNLNRLVKGLHEEEKKVYQIISDSDGSVFQNDIIAKTGFSKVKVSRILDRLETKDIVERRRRGMSNLVVLK